MSCQSVVASILQGFYFVIAVLIELISPLCRVLLSLPFIGGADLSTKYYRVIERHDEKIQRYFRGKVCWVTGASSGIGRSLALLLAKHGAFVILSARTSEDLERVAEECRQERERFIIGVGTQVEERFTTRDSTMTTSSETNGPEDKRDIGAQKIFQGVYELVLPMDLSDLNQFPEVANKAFGWKKRIDFLFNNGGVTSRAPLCEFAIDEKVTTVDFLAPIYLTKLCLGILLKSEPLTEEFHVVNTSSIASRIHTCARAPYGSSKAALNINSSILQLESRVLLSQDNYRSDDGRVPPKVHVTNCLPGLVNTNLLDRAVVSQGAQVTNEMKSRFQYAMPPNECAQWMVSATMSQRDEAWIGSRFELFGVYLSYYCPMLWERVWHNGGFAKRIYNFDKPEVQNSIDAISSRLLLTR